MNGSPGDWIRPRRVHRVMAVRARITADSKLICGAGPYDLVLFVRECPETEMVELSGRITRAGREREPVSGLSLALVTGAGEALGTGARTDEYGEFRIDAGIDTRYGLRVGPEEDSPCVLVWEKAAG